MEHIIFFRDGRIECEGDRVPCNYSIKRSLHYGDPLVIDPMFQDQSRYGKAKRYPSSNPRRNDEMRGIYYKLLGAVLICMTIWKHSGLAQLYGFEGLLAFDLKADGYNDVERYSTMASICIFVFISAVPVSYAVQAIRWRFVRLLSRISNKRRT